MSNGGNEPGHAGQLSSDAVDTAAVGSGPAGTGVFSGRMRAGLAVAFIVNAAAIPYLYIAGQAYGLLAFNKEWRDFYLWCVVTPALILLLERVPVLFAYGIDLIYAFRSLPPREVQLIEAQAELLDKEIEKIEKETTLCNAKIALQSTRLATQPA